MLRKSAASVFNRYFLMCLHNSDYIRATTFEAIWHSIFSSENVTGMRSRVRERDTGYRHGYGNDPLELHAVLEDILNNIRYLEWSIDILQFAIYKWNIDI